MKYIASCSFGKDSLAMVLRILEEELPLDEAIFFDTGMEFDSIYHNRDRMKKILAEHKILFSELSSKNHFLFDMFVRPVKYIREFQVICIIKYIIILKAITENVRFLRLRLQCS